MGLSEKNKKIAGSNKNKEISVGPNEIIKDL